MREESSDGGVVLFCQNLCGSHNSCLITVLYGDEYRQQGDDGLSGAHIPLQEAVHGLGRLHIFYNLLQDLPLGRCQMEGKGFFQHLANVVIDGESNTLTFGRIPSLPQG